MKSLLAFITLSVVLSTFNSASACVGGYLNLNKTDGLAADGIYGSKGLMFSVDQLKNLRISKGKATLRFTENDTKAVTHVVEYLGSIQDEYGIIQSSYLVNDVNLKTEKVVILNSNYQGNGVSARGLPSQDDVEEAKIPTKRDGFKSLYSVGCN